ncbi:MAG TPA: radical SAM protein, partial [Gammaproteobacteria bacterium]
MKQISSHFNKTSRLTIAPELSGVKKRNLRDFDARTLPDRLASLLTIQNDFYPCFDWTFPPPLLQKSEPAASPQELFSEPSVIPGRYSIYLHSPFCKSLCSFCYYSVIPGRGIELAEKYIDYLIREMAMYAETFRGQICESVYFGGGTPSYLSNELLAKIFTALHQYFNIDENAEISIEASPGTLPKQKSIFLQSLGINRLSYGIQTLDANLLARMNRDYSVSEAIDELRHAINIIGNVNVDTMYGFEGEGENTLLETLQHFYQIGVPSFSIYALDRQRTESKHGLEPPKDEFYTHKINQFSRAETLLGSWGYRPVLQNVFIDPERASYRHQLRRWDNLPLLAMGINSQGYAPKRPYQNAGSL